MDVICFGCIIVDHRRPADDGPVAGAVPLRLVENAVNLTIGGVPILAAALKQLGLDVALMGCVGTDIAGYGLLGYLRCEAGLNVEAVRTVPGPTSSSFIRLTGEQRYIEHTPGASAAVGAGPAELEFVRRRRPRLVAIGYAGLLPRLDADHGRDMARWIGDVQGSGALAALDTHTVASYDMLDGPAPRADLFLCNVEEAHGITGLDFDRPRDVVAAMWQRYPPADPARYRLLGVAAPHGAQFAYGRGGDPDFAWVANPHHGTFRPRDLTGAGDYFRAGVYAEVIGQGDAFASGRIDLARLGRAGHDVACEHLRRPAGRP